MSGSEKPLFIITNCLPAFLVDKSIFIITSTFSACLCKMSPRFPFSIIRCILLHSSPRCVDFKACIGVFKAFILYNSDCVLLEGHGSASHNTCFLVLFNAFPCMSEKNSASFPSKNVLTATQDGKRSISCNILFLYHAKVLVCCCYRK